MKGLAPYAYLSILLMLVISLSTASWRGKEVAVTIDDLPLNGPDIGLERLRTMTSRILTTIREHHVPVVGFVNEGLLYVPGEADERIAVLRQWPEAGVELGNHSFSHLGFQEASLSDYKEDFIRNETVIRRLMKPFGQEPRYFRHPFLQMGPTLEDHKAFEEFIDARGYKMAPITVSSEDWLYFAAYEEASARDDRAAMRRVSDDYLDFAEANFEASEQKSAGLFGRQVKHILMLHANELNADGGLDRLFTMLEDRGYTFITLDDALSDPFYQLPPRYTPTSDWLGLWAISKGKQFATPTPPEYIQKAFDDAQDRVLGLAP